MKNIGFGLQRLTISQARRNLSFNYYRFCFIWKWKTWSNHIFWKNHLVKTVLRQQIHLHKEDLALEGQIKLELCYQPQIHTQKAM